MNPQIENGFTKMANELLDELIKINLSGQELRACLFVIRKTYGFNKKEDYIALKQFQLALNIGKIRASQIITSLTNRNLLTVIENINGMTKCYMFNKHYDTWQTVNKYINRIEKHKQTVNILLNPPLIKTLTTKETSTKETSTKEINIPFDVFWNLYDKEVGKINKLTVKWNKLTDTVRQKIINYIPQYKISQPNKKFRKNADTFFDNESWNDEIINDKIDNKDGTMTREGFRTNLPLSQRLTR